MYMYILVMFQLNVKVGIPLENILCRRKNNFKDRFSMNCLSKKWLIYLPLYVTRVIEFQITSNKVIMSLRNQNKICTIYLKLFFNADYF